VKRRLAQVVAGIVLAVSGATVGHFAHWTTGDQTVKECQVDTSQQGYWCSDTQVEWIPLEAPTHADCVSDCGIND